MYRPEGANSLILVCSDSAGDAAAEHVKIATTVHGSSLSATDESDYIEHKEVNKGLTTHDEALASKGAALQLPLQGRALEVGHHQGQDRHFGAVLGHKAGCAPRAGIHYDQPCLHFKHFAVHWQHQACDSASAGCLRHSLVNHP